MRASSILIYLLTAIFFFFSSIAEGAKWELILETKEYSLFVDTENIRHVSDTVVAAWTKKLFKKPRPSDSKNINTTFTYDEYNCNEGKVRLLQITHYYTDATNNSFSYPNAEWRYLIPDTIGSYEHNYLCKKAKTAQLPEAPIPEPAPALDTKGSEVRLQENEWIKIVDQSVEKLTAEEFYKENITESWKGKIIRKLQVKIQFLRPCTATTKVEEWVNKHGGLSGDPNELIPMDDEEGQYIAALIAYVEAGEEGKVKERQEIFHYMFEKFPNQDMTEYITPQFRCDYRNKIYVTFFSPQGKELSTMSDFVRSYEKGKTTIQKAETRSITFFIPEEATSWHVWVPK